MVLACTLVMGCHHAPRRIVTGDPNLNAVSRESLPERCFHRSRDDGGNLRPSIAEGVDILLTNYYPRASPRHPAR
jgi:hypothetical protein